MSDKVEQSLETLVKKYAMVVPQYKRDIQGLAYYMFKSFQFLDNHTMTGARLLLAVKSQIDFWDYLTDVLAYDISSELYDYAMGVHLELTTFYAYLMEEIENEES